MKAVTFYARCKDTLLNKVQRTVQWNEVCLDFWVAFIFTDGGALLSSTIQYFI